MSNLGEGTLPKYVKKASSFVRVVGVIDNLTEHGLRATCITFLFEAGQQMQVIARKTGHRDPRLALSYHKTQGFLGQEIQADAFLENDRNIHIAMNGKRPVVQRNIESMPCKAVKFNDSTYQLRSPITTQANYLSNINTLGHSVVYSHQQGSDDGSTIESV